ncbi:hypothetical protein Cgig2_003250 [Carnegiea gigantea]|uniref:Uncharacterized protein n=1 Tax=Carnegiea gigantea TaxID=171969 RepID=A0A9Q1JUK2_9CARY|nr:hypothetical protein Cgig2_003250 [Carnegiea gigantea]
MPIVQKGHVSEVEISNDSDEEENEPTCEEEHVNGDNDQRDEEEKTTISDIGKVVSNSNKPALKSKCDHRIEFEEEVGNEKRTYHKAFITGMSMCSFSSMINGVALQIARKFSKWLIESFGPYAIYCRLLDGKIFQVIVFDVYLTLGLPIGGKQIVQISKSSTNEEYEHVHTVWMKEWNIDQKTSELTRIMDFILSNKDGGGSFWRNFIIYMVNCFFSGSKNCYYSKSFLQNVKDVNQIVSLD